MNTNQSLAQRRFDLDWLRVLAIACVFIFHTTRFFDSMDWHVKNATTYGGLDIYDAFFTLWGMPLIFVLSGASLFFALKPSMLRFIDDKVRRLLVPLVVNIFTLCVLQVYLERITHAQFSGSFVSFIPHYFEGWYPFDGGNFAWMGMHLWYLEMLFLYSLLLMPLLYWLKLGGGQRILKWIGNWLDKPMMIYFSALPVSLLLVTLDPNSILGARAFGAWSFVPYIVFLLAGFLVMSSEGAQKRIIQYRVLSLVLGGITTFGLVWSWQAWGLGNFGTLQYTVFFALFGFAAWCWIQTVLGFGFRYLNAPRPILAYVGEGVLPFYILHQTVLLSVGYFVVQWQIPDLLKWAILASVSLFVIALVYEFAIRRINVLRFLFGMKPHAGAALSRRQTRQREAMSAVKPVH